MIKNIAIEISEAIVMCFRERKHHYMNQTTLPTLRLLCAELQADAARLSREAVEKRKQATALQQLIGEIRQPVVPDNTTPILAIVSGGDARVFITTTRLTHQSLIDRAVKVLGKIDFTRTVFVSFKTENALQAMSMTLREWHRDDGHETDIKGVFNASVFAPSCRFLVYARTITGVEVIDWHKGSEITGPSFRECIDGPYSEIVPFVLESFKNDHLRVGDDRPMVESDAARFDHRQHCAQG